MGRLRETWLSLHPPMLDELGLGATLDWYCQEFEKQTGIKMKYTEAYNDNNEYFAKIQPNLQKGKSIGRDGFVLTDWMAGIWIQNGYAQTLVDLYTAPAGSTAGFISPDLSTNGTLKSGYIVNVAGDTGAVNILAAGAACNANTAATVSAT